jgi:serine/threonine-protein kinase HSL1, negative regulator of Swe1 kinase
MMGNMADPQALANPPTRPPLADTTRRVNNTLNILGPLQSKVAKKDAAGLHHTRSHSIKSKSRNGVPVENYFGTRPVPVAPKSDEAKRISMLCQGYNPSGRSDEGYKTHIGPWQLGRTLGKGSSAKVRLCRHVLTRQLAAVKIVRKNSTYLIEAGSLAALDKFDQSLPEQINGELRVPPAIEREVAILKLVEHPNIMKLYDIWENRREL